MGSRLKQSFFLTANFFLILTGAIYTLGQIPLTYFPDL